MNINDTYRWYELVPTDAWFFRDGRPMNRGEDARGVRSLFPPTLETIVGSFRAALARAKGWKGYGDWPQAIKEVLGDGFDDLGKVVFLGPFLSRHQQPLFPCPRHLLLEKKTGQPGDWLRPSEPVQCDLGEAVCLPLPPSRGAENPELTEVVDYYITVDGLKKVLQGELPRLEDLVHASALYLFETRVGIFRDEQTRTVGEASLYNPTFVRLKPGVGLLVGVSGLPTEWAVPRLFPLGGESRTTHCSPVESPLAPLADCPKGDLLLALTPTIAPNEPWYCLYPGDELDSLDESLGGKVRTVRCERPILLPAWDSIKRHPRPQLAAIPAGTVWWLDGSTSSGLRQVGKRRSHGYGLVISAKTPQIRQ